MVRGREGGAGGQVHVRRLQRQQLYDGLPDAVLWLFRLKGLGFRFSSFGFRV